MLQEIEQNRQEMRQQYAGIAETAYETIRACAVQENPVLLGAKDYRYALYVCGFIEGAADIYLSEVTQRIVSAEPSMRPMPDGFRHVTIRELQFNEEGRHNAGIDAQRACEYYKALQSEFAIPGFPISLELHRIILTQDREQKSVSLSAAFLPKDASCGNIRKKVVSALEKAALPLTERRPLSLILCTLGRFPYAPRKVDGWIPVLHEIDQANANMPEERETYISALTFGSTTPRSYIWPYQHAFLTPSISLVQENTDVVPVVRRIHD